MSKKEMPEAAVEAVCRHRFGNTWKDDGWEDWRRKQIRDEIRAELNAAFPHMREEESEIMWIERYPKERHAEPLYGMIEEDWVNDGLEHIKDKEGFRRYRIIPEPIEDTQKKTSNKKKRKCINCNVREGQHHVRKCPGVAYMHGCLLVEIEDEQHAEPKEEKKPGSDKCWCSSCLRGFLCARGKKYGVIGDDE